MSVVIHEHAYVRLCFARAHVSFCMFPDFRMCACVLWLFRANASAFGHHEIVLCMYVCVCMRYSWCPVILHELERSSVRVRARLHAHNNV